jgi:hypothetical protein
MKMKRCLLLILGAHAAHGALRGARRLAVPSGCKLTPSDYQLCESTGGCCTAYGCQVGKACDIEALGVHAGPDAGSQVEDESSSGVSDGAVNVHTIDEETPFGEAVPEFGNAVGAIAPERMSNSVHASSWAELFETPRAGATWVQKFKQITRTPAPTPTQNFWGSANIGASHQAATAGLDDQVKFDPNEATDFAPARDEFWARQPTAAAAAATPTQGAPPSAHHSRWSNQAADEGFNILHHEVSEQDHEVLHPYTGFDGLGQKRRRKKKAWRAPAQNKKFNTAEFQDMNNALMEGHMHEAMMMDHGVGAAAQQAQQQRQSSQQRSGGQSSQALLAGLTSQAGLDAMMGHGAHRR